MENRRGDNAFIIGYFICGRSTITFEVILNDSTCKHHADISDINIVDANENALLQKDAENTGNRKLGSFMEIIKFNTVIFIPRLAALWNKHMA